MFHNTELKCKFLRSQLLIVNIKAEMKNLISFNIKKQISRIIVGNYLCMTNHQIYSRETVKIIERDPKINQEAKEKQKEDIAEKENQGKNHTQIAYKKSTCKGWIEKDCDNNIGQYLDKKIEYNKITKD